MLCLCTNTETLSSLHRSFCESNEVSSFVLSVFVVSSCFLLFSFFFFLSFTLPSFLFFSSLLALPLPPSTGPHLSSLFPDHCDHFGDNHRQVTPSPTRLPCISTTAQRHPPLHPPPRYHLPRLPRQQNYLQDTSTHDKSKRLHSPIPGFSTKSYPSSLNNHNRTAHHHHTYTHTSNIYPSHHNSPSFQQDIILLPSTKHDFCVLRSRSIFC